MQTIARPVAPAATPAVTAAATADDSHWYKDAVVYQLHVKAFFDSNNDGIGDLAGLTSQLDYVKELGVNTVWLLPFYPSPLKDDGYDVADYRNVHPWYGTRADFREFVREAHRRGLRVITELIVNHTSDQHPWFQAARRAPRGSGKRAYYVWSDDPKRYAGTRIIFTDTEKSNWAWDDLAQQFYWHRFFSHQPDLNFDNPQVLKAVFRTMRFWLDMGVDGFRLDAIPYLVEREGTNNENLPETHAVLKKIRAQIDASYRGKLLLAEANQWPEDVREYFGDGDECHMAYHFPLMPRMYMAIALEDRHPITEIMGQTPEIPESCQWAIFLRNHDELTLEMVTSRERDYMYNMYAADKRARINLGIRRRLAPLMENDLGRIRLMKSLLLSMPGSPILYYGDEIGMGDNIYLGDRDGVRTPMQWSAERNAGFSRADPQRLYLQPIMDPIYGYQAVNVESQERDPSSLLHWTRRMLAVRKPHAAFGRGQLRFLRPANRKILAYIREYRDETILCVANLSRNAQPVELDLGAYRGRVPIEMMGRTAFPPVGERPYLLTLSGHGFLWFRLAPREDAPVVADERLARDELPVLVLFDAWASLFRDRVVPWRIGMAEKVREQLEQEVLPAFVEGRRWYAGKGTPVARAELADSVEWKPAGRSYLVALVRSEQAGGERQTYFMPLALAWEDHDDERLRALEPHTIAKVRQQAAVGVLADAFADEAFCRELVRAVGAGGELRTEHGRIAFRPTNRFTDLARDDFDRVPFKTPGAQTSNTTVVFEDRLFLKGYRRLAVGENPEVEIGRYLTEVARFPHAVPVAGSVEYLGNDGRNTTLALVQGYVLNQGDGWTYTISYLDRFFDALPAAAEAQPKDVHGAYVALARTLGVRTAQLHAAFNAATGDPAFDPEPVTADDVSAWVERVRSEAASTLERLASRASGLPGPAGAEARGLVGRREELLERIAAHAHDRTAGPKTRVHGDYHLGQTLLARNDFVITDFEGEPSRPVEERRRKQSPLKDVAGMLRSFDYAMNAALMDVARERPDAHALLEAAGREWRSHAELAFVDGYESIAAGSGLASPRAERTGILELMLIEKAVYELAYEVDNRPDWVRIPIRGLSGILDG